MKGLTLITLLMIIAAKSLAIKVFSQGTKTLEQDYTKGLQIENPPKDLVRSVH